MIITHHGIDSFKVSFGDTTLSINPISKNSDFKNSRFGADIVLISSNDTEHNGYENNERSDKKSFVISGPGEYEVSGIFIKGFLSKTNYKKEGLNTVYTIALEGMNLVFLGAMGDDSLNSEVKKATENCDILFIPIGGDGVLNASNAQKIAVQFEPRIIIPSHFDTIGEKDALSKFLKESGVDKANRVEKLTIKKKDIENMEGEVIVLDPQI